MTLHQPLLYNVWDLMPTNAGMPDSEHGKQRYCSLTGVDETILFGMSSYRQGGVLIQLIFGSDSKACVVAACCPGQVDCRLQVAVHLLVNGAS